MKSAGILAIFFAAFNFNVLADDVALSDNPYAPVVDRNIFGLVPIPVNAPPETKPPDPPSKITPNGIMNLFGELQVLFKVSVPAKPGLPPHDQSYTMSVGERSDGIEVTKIDKQAGVITFDNHGIIQELSLSKAVASAAPQPAAVPTGFRPSGSNGFRGRLNPNGNQSFGGNNYNHPDAHAYGNNRSIPSYGSTPATGDNNNTSQSQSTDDLSLESKVVMMEAQRAQWQQQGNPGMAIMPPPIVKGVGGDDSPTTPSGSPVP